MNQSLSREQLIELVTMIADARGAEEEVDAWIALLEANVAHPAVADLIFHNDEELSPEEIVKRALSYKPITVE